MAQSASANYLLAANRESASISIVAPDSMEVVGEALIGQRLSALASVSNTKLFVATDEAAHEIILFSCDGQRVRPKFRLGVAHTPVDVQVTADGSRCFVSSLWAHAVTVVDIHKAESRLELEATVSLPFAPRKQLLIQEGKWLVVADSFAGQLACVDTERMQLESITRFQGCNIRGLAQSVDGDRLFVSHQHVNPLAHSSKDDVRWGLLVTNHLRIFDVPAIVPSDTSGSNTASGQLKRNVQGHLVHLGDFGRGAADPAELVVTQDGKLVVALAGFNRITVADATQLVFEDVDVGHRPTAMLLDAVSGQVYVANTFSDSISVVEVTQAEVTGEIELGPMPQLTARDAGELLFFDGRLSLDGWMSCHSCHTDGHTNGLLSDTLSDGTFGTPKKVLSLLGVNETVPMGWNGKTATLEQQIESSLKNTMHSKRMTQKDVDRLSAYLSSLEPAPASYIAGATNEVLAERADVARGKALFQRLQCATCHTPPNFTSADTYDVGLVDELGYRDFNPPSLRGVSQRQSFFHDGRAHSLADVFMRHQHQLPGVLSERDVADLVLYLQTI